MQRHHRTIRGPGQDTSLQEKTHRLPIRRLSITDPVEPIPWHTRLSQQRHHIQNLLRRGRRIRIPGLDLLEPGPERQLQSPTHQTRIRLTIGLLQRHIQRLPPQLPQII